MKTLVHKLAAVIAALILLATVSPQARAGEKYGKTWIYLTSGGKLKLIGTGKGFENMGVMSTTISMRNPETGEIEQVAVGHNLLISPFKILDDISEKSKKSPDE